MNQNDCWRFKKLHFYFGVEFAEKKKLNLRSKLKSSLIGLG